MSPASEETVVNNTGEVPPRYSEWRRIIRVLATRPIVLAAMVMLIILIGTAIFAPFIAPYDPYEQELTRALEQPSSEHWLGTDALGRDELSRIIYGSRVSLMVGIIAVGIGSAGGILLGTITGFFGGRLDTIIMRGIDAWMCIPGLVLMLIIAGILGGGLTNIMIAVGLGMVPGFSRITRSLVMSINQREYIMAAHSIGASDLRIILRCIVPNTLPVLIVMMSMAMGGAIMAEAGLSFLGLGINPPGAAWGAMISSGYKYLLSNPLLSFIPGFCIMLVVLSFNLAGDGLRDALDPKLRGVI